MPIIEKTDSELLPVATNPSWQDIAFPSAIAPQTPYTIPSDGVYRVSVTFLRSADLGYQGVFPPEYGSNGDQQNSCAARFMMQDGSTLFLSNINNINTIELLAQYTTVAPFSDFFWMNTIHGFCVAVKVPLVAGNTIKPQIHGFSSDRPGANLVYVVPQSQFEVTKLK